MMMKLMMVGVALISSVSAFATTCELHSRFAQDAVQYVVNSRHNTPAKRQLAAMVQTSCQRDAVVALVDAQLATTPKMRLALEIDNAYQAQAFACLASNGVALPNKYEVALTITAQCGADAFCEVVETNAFRLAPYLAAASCR